MKSKINQKIALVEVYLPPIPVPSPPKTSPYWDRHFQILGPRQWLWVPCDVRPAEDRGRESQKRTKDGILSPAILGVRAPDPATARLAEPYSGRLTCTYRALYQVGGNWDIRA